MWKIFRNVTIESLFFDSVNSCNFIWSMVAPVCISLGAVVWFLSETEELICFGKKTGDSSEDEFSCEEHSYIASEEIGCGIWICWSASEKCFADFRAYHKKNNSRQLYLEVSVGTVFQFSKFTSKIISYTPFQQQLF